LNPARIAGRCISYSRMDTTASFLFLHILFRRTTAVISIGVFAFGKDLTGVCFGDAQSLPSVWRSSDPYGRAVGSVFHVVRPEDG